MPLTEITYLAGAVAVLATLRFGIPLVVMWAVGKAAHRFTHAPS
jgi:UDP:flavonoid glycosyltransferase YjiC (YdhE family)